MAYCSKCGIEVESNIKYCPLCNFQIPDINISDKNKDKNIYENKKFPIFKNMYIEKVLEIKRNIFFGISALLLLNIGLFVYLLIISIPNIHLPLGIMIILSSIWIYLFLLFGFLRNIKLTIFGIALNTTALNFFCDFLTTKLDWFFFISIPSITLGTVITIIVTTIIHYTKNKTINMILIISTGLSAFLIGFEIIIKLYYTNRITLSWSIFLSIEIMILSLLIMFFCNNIPKKILDKLIKKTHI